MIFLPLAALAHSETAVRLDQLAGNGLLAAGTSNLMLLLSEVQFPYLPLMRLLFELDGAET